MRNLLSLLLIPLAVLGQCLPHSHAGIGTGGMDDHASRSHVHISGGHKHDPLDGHCHGEGHHAEDHHDGRLDEERGQDRHAPHIAGTGLPLLAQAITGPAVDSSSPVEHDSDAIYIADPSFAIKIIESVLRFDSLDLAFLNSIQSVFGKAVAKTRISHPPDRFASLPIFLTVNSLLL